MDETKELKPFLIKTKKYENKIQAYSNVLSCPFKKAEHKSE